MGYLEASLRARGGTLEGELARVGGVSQVCTLRGLVSCAAKGRAVHAAGPGAPAWAGAACSSCRAQCTLLSPAQRGQHVMSRDAAR